MCVVWQDAFSYLCGLAGCINAMCISLHLLLLVDVDSVTFLSVFFLPSGNPPKAFIIGFFDVCQQTDRPIGFLDVCRQTDRPTGVFDVYRQTDGPIGFSDARVRYSLCVDRLTIIRNDATNLINIFEKADHSLSDVSNISLFVKTVNRLSLVKI